MGGDARDRVRRLYAFGRTGTAGRRGVPIALAGTAMLLIAELASIPIADARMDDTGATVVGALFGLGTLLSGVGLIGAGTNTLRTWSGPSRYALPEVRARDLVRTPLLEDAYRVVLPPAHRLARRRRPLTLDDLADEPWIGGSPTSAWFRIVREACGFPPAVEYTTDDYLAVQSLVAAGLGVSVIPGLAVVHPLPGVAVRTLSGAPVRWISAARPRDGYHGPAVTVMLESLAWSSASISR